MMAAPQPEGFPSYEAIILVADLAGFARAFENHPDGEMARFLDGYYSVAEDVISGADGRIVKFMGDSVLATFDSTLAESAISAAVSLRAATERLARDMGLSVELGVNLHLGPVVEAELGKGRTRRRDIVGHAVNQAFLLGRGSGIRLSEPVYRGLPSSERTPWTRHEALAIYLFEEDEG